MASCNAFLELVDEQAHGGSTESLNQAIRDRFEVYQSIGGFDESGKNFTNTVLFTGYFTPIYDGSLTRTAEFQWPLYKRPADLISDPEGITASRRTPDGKYELYYTRQQLENSDKLKGTELVYLKSRWDAYVITVQLASGENSSAGRADLRKSDTRGTMDFLATRRPVARW